MCFSYLPVTFFLLAMSLLESDIAFLKVVFTVWYDGAKALHWKEIICSGADDQYYVCEMLKGGQYEKYTFSLPCRLPSQQGHNPFLTTYQIF